MQKYKDYRNKTNKLIRKVKMDYYCNKLNENKNDIKKIWATVKESLNENKNYIKYKIKEGDNYITEENTLCEII